MKTKPWSTLGQRQLTSAVAATYSTTVAAAGLSLVNVLITSRALGAAGRGELAFLTTVAMLSATLASLGVEEANGNLGWFSTGLEAALATNSLLLSALLGSVASGLLIVIIATFPAVGGGSSQMLLAVAIAVVPVDVLQMLCCS